MRTGFNVPALRVLAPAAAKTPTIADYGHLAAYVRDMLERKLARAHARPQRLLPPRGGGTRFPGQRTRIFFRPRRIELAAVADNGYLHLVWKAELTD